MQALWGEPWTARSVSVDGNEVVPFRGDVIDLWLLAKQCTMTQWRQGAVERRRNGGAAQGSVRLVRFDPRILFLALVVFSVLSRTFSKHCRKKSVDQWPPKSKAEFQTPIVDFLCVKVLRRVKKDRTFAKKFKSSLSQRAGEHPMQWVKKQRTGGLEQASFERKSSSSKANGRQSRSTGFARDFGWIVAGTKPSGRTLDLYIYIANDESPSQHVTVGLAEARPN